MAKNPLIIIPVFIHRPDHITLLTRCLASLRDPARTASKIDIILIDDCSPFEKKSEILKGIASQFNCDLVEKPKNTGFCSPPDEPVLTSNHGYVPIGQLDPSIHGLVTFVRNENVIRGVKKSPNRQNGYKFESCKSYYCGDMISIETEDGIARVTPNHGITFRWTKEALDGYCVYLMRKGNKWRIGKTSMTHYKSCFGPTSRKKNQEAEDIWILSMHESNQEALKQEALISWKHRVPTLQFKTSGINGISQHHLDEIWEALDVEQGALEILSHFGMSAEFPYATSCRPRVRGRQNLLTVNASNLLPGYMLIPTLSGECKHFTLSRSYYDGEVVSLDVIPHHHYISNGVVVHNSKTVNIGMMKAHDEGRAAVLCNMDMEFSVPGFECKNWLKIALKDPADLVGARLLYPNGLIQHGGVYYSLLHRYLDHLYRYAPPNMKDANVRTEVPVTGALQIIKPQVMDAVGYYDEHFKMAYEDIDYCLRVMLPAELGGAGLKVAYNPEVVATHHESMIRGGQQKYSQWHDESWIYFQQKYARTPMQNLIPPIDRKR